MLFSTQFTKVINIVIKFSAHIGNFFIQYTVQKGNIVINFAVHLQYTSSTYSTLIVIQFAIYLGNIVIQFTLRYNINNKYTVHLFVKKNNVKIEIII